MPPRGWPVSEVFRVLVIALLVIVLVAIAFNDPGRYYQARLEAQRLAQDGADTALSVLLQTNNATVARDAAQRTVAARGGTVQSFEVAGKLVRVTVSLPVSNTFLIGRLKPLDPYRYVTASAEASQKQ